MKDTHYLLDDLPRGLGGPVQGHIPCIWTAPPGPNRSIATFIYFCLSFKRRKVKVVALAGSNHRWIHQWKRCMSATVRYQFRATFVLLREYN